MNAPRPPLLLCGVVSLVFALGCACGASAYTYDCENDEYEAWGSCIPLDCSGDNPFGSFSGAEVVFVHADSDAEDDSAFHGTEDAPYRTIGVGIANAMASGGRHVVVGIGTYSEQITLDSRHAGLQIVGVCGGEVIVEGVGAAAVFLEGDASTDVHIESMTLRHDESWGAAVLQGVLSMTDVRVEGAIGAGVAALGADATLELTDVTVRNIRASEVTGTGSDGFGLALTEGATATATRLTIEGSETAAIYASDDGSSLVLLGATLVGQAPPADGEDEDDGLGRGAGMLVYDGASATVFDATVTDMWDVGFELAGRGGSALLERTDFVGVHAGGNVGMRLGTAVGAYDGASVTLREFSIEGAALYGVVAAGSATGVTLEDGWVGASNPDPEEQSAGIGLVAVDGAVIDALDVVVEGAATAGGLADAATLRLTDTEVLDTVSTANQGLGVGLVGQRGGELDLFRVSVVGSDTVGILIDVAEASLVEVEVHDTRRGPVQTTAVGVVAQATATVELADLTVTDTEGPGLLVAGAASVTGSDATLHDNAFAGLLVADQAYAELAGGDIEGTLVDASQGGGTGVHVQGPGAHLVLSDFDVRGNAHAAVHIAGPVEVELDDNVLIGGAATRTLWPTGTAVFASLVGAADLQLSGNQLSDSEGAGLFLDAATATLSGNTWSGNGVDVVQQLCDVSTVTPVGLAGEAVATTELCPPYDRPVDPFVYSAVYVPPDLD